MSTASLEICKELYQVGNGAWDETEKVWCPYSIDGGLTEQWQLETRVGQPYDWPAYDLGYLLRKLPDGASIQRVGDRYNASLSYNKVDTYGHQTSHTDGTGADTPEDAAAAFAIDLFKQGAFTRAGDA